MMKLRNLLAASAAVLSVGAVQADVVGVIDPAGWDRGDADSGYLEFDVFSDVVSIGNAASGSGGSMTGALDATVTDGILIGAPTDNRIYDGGNNSVYDITASASSFDINYLLLQVKENAGAGIASPYSVTLDGAAASSTSIFDDGNGHSITSFYWDLGSTITAGTSFNLSVDNFAGFQHDSIDSFSIDASVSAIPVPAAAWLFGSALVGLGVVRRKN